MNEGIKSLAPSLVGSSIDFSFRKKVSDATHIDENIASEKRRIRKNVEAAFEAGGNLCVTLLAEMTSFYSKEIYYMAVRGSIEMRRYRPLVLEYLEKSVEERMEHLIELLSEKPKWRGEDNRDVKVEATRYFLSTYAGRIKFFKPYLTKEEYMIVV